MCKHSISRNKCQISQISADLRLIYTNLHRFMPIPRGPFGGSQGSRQILRFVLSDNITKSSPYETSSGRFYFKLIRQEMGEIFKF